jgi:hypothetical protein
VLDFRIDHLFVVDFLRSAGNRSVTVTRVAGEVTVFADIAAATIDHGYSEVNPVFPD